VTNALQTRWIYGASGLFVLLNALFLYFEVYWFIAIPAALAIVTIALFKIHWLLLLITFSVPLSIGLDDVGGGLGLSVPTDPLLFGAMLVFLLRQTYEMNYDRRILTHPISVAIYFFLFWIFITALTSELPVVSLKFFLARLWFIVPFYFIAVQMFRYPDLVSKYMWMYVVPFSGVVIYTLIRQGVRGFDAHSAHWVMQPFYKDHTIYGAMLAFYIPITFMYMFNKKYDINAKILSGFFFGILMVGVVASLTRAAWVSLVGGLFLLAVIKFRIRWWILMLAGLVGIVFFLSFQTEVIHKLEKNRQDSSGDLAEHVESISNVATDASNLERLNRWSCAFRMFFESPVLGKGPGTYSFLYAPYQRSSELTVISTNFGNLGNAHSEYFGRMAEQGVPGLITFLVIIALVYVRGVPLYYQMKDRNQAMVLLATIISLTTYFIHATLNNYLDQDKAAITFWGFLAIVVAFDVYAERMPKDSSVSATLPEADE
jgi:O-antigen ligase